MTCKKNQDC